LGGALRLGWCLAMGRCWVWVAVWDGIEFGCWAMRLRPGPDLAVLEQRPGLGAALRLSRARARGVGCLSRGRARALALGRGLGGALRPMVRLRAIREIRFRVTGWSAAW